MASVFAFVATCLQVAVIRLLFIYMVCFLGHLKSTKASFARISIEEKKSRSDRIAKYTV